MSYDFTEDLVRCDWPDCTATSESALGDYIFLDHPTFMAKFHHDGWVLMKLVEFDDDDERDFCPAHVPEAMTRAHEDVSGLFTSAAQAPDTPDWT